MNFSRIFQHEGRKRTKPSFFTIIGVLISPMVLPLVCLRAQSGTNESEPVTSEYTSEMAQKTMSDSIYKEIHADLAKNIEELSNMEADLMTILELQQNDEDVSDEDQEMGDIILRVLEISFNCKVRATLILDFIYINLCISNLEERQNIAHILNGNKQQFVDMNKTGLKYLKKYLNMSSKEPLGTIGRGLETKLYRINSILEMFDFHSHPDSIIKT
jgi:hypothetical protein